MHSNIFSNADPDDDALDSHLLCYGVNPRLHRSGSLPLIWCHSAVSPSPLRQSRNPGPQAVGWRLCALPFRWSLPLSVAWTYLVYLSAPAPKTLKSVGVGRRINRARVLACLAGSDSQVWGVVGMRTAGEEVTLNIGRNRGVIKVGQESCMAIGHPGKS